MRKLRSSKVLAGMDRWAGDRLVVLSHEKQMAPLALESVLLVRRGRLPDKAHGVTAIGALRIFRH